MLTFNKRPRLSGKYLELKKPSGDAPAYYMKEFQVFLFKQGNNWMISKTLQSQSAMAYSPESDLPTEGDMDWKYWHRRQREWKETTVSFEYHDEDEENEDKWPDAYIVKCRYGQIDGPYVKTEDELENVPVYFNEKDEKFLYYTSIFAGKFWVIDNDKNPYAAFFRSSVTDFPARDRPEDVVWNGVEVFPFYEKEEEESEDEDEEVENFEDEDFPPNFNSIQVEDITEDNVKWVHAETICSMGGEPKLFNKIEPNDVAQGAVGDCWLLAAISSIAEFPSFIEKELFKEQTDVSDNHKYTVRLYDTGTADGEGEWKDIEIDSLIPCRNERYQTNYTPLFAGTKENEMYVLLLEKAFAKYTGSYKKLSGGFTSYAWMNMTGCEEQYIWSRQGQAWIPSMLSMDARHEDPTNFQTAYTISPDGVNPKGPDAFWEYLVSCDKDNFLLSTSIGGDVLERPRTDGLVERHAYSLLQAKEIGEIRLIQLRNPWGNSMEWNGDWSDKSELWEQHPEVTEEIGYSRDVNDGKFWMPYVAFQNTWESVYVSAMSMPTTRGDF